MDLKGKHMAHNKGRRLGFNAKEHTVVARRSRIETVTYSMPVYWASYLINGDASGIDDDEIAEADAAIEDIGLGAPVDVGESEFRHSGDYGHLAGDYADYTFHKIEGANEARAARHRVADFNTLDDLIAHARDELGASHVVVAGPESKIYFPRGGTHAYEAASVRRKGGYWHADGPGAREGVTEPASGGTAHRRWKGGKKGGGGRSKANQTRPARRRFLSQKRAERPRTRRRRRTGSRPRRSGSRETRMASRMAR